MLTFEVEDMTCGHCVNAITKAVNSLDPQAQVQVDLTTHRVEVRPATADTASLIHAIQVAGYAAEAVEGAAKHAASAPPARAGCCCR